MNACSCGDCCARRTHYDTEESAGRAAGAIWTRSRVSRHPALCPACSRWFITRRTHR